MGPEVGVTPSGPVLTEAFASLSTPLVADACVRPGLPLRIAPPGIRSLSGMARVAGRALPARHAGSVDVFLEAFERAEPGDELVIDDGGRRDRACVGDLVAIEAQAAGLSALIVWGVVRDADELDAIGLPIFVYGRAAPGPVAAEPSDAVRSGTTIRDQLQFGAYLLRRGDDPGFTFRAHLCDIDGAIEE